MKGFGAQVIKGGAWIAALEILNQLLQFFKTFIAARILTPGDFGIIGFAFLIITFIEVLSTTGMKEAIIQRTDDLQSYLSTVWLIEAGKGTVVLGLTFFLAPVMTHWIGSSNALLTERVIRFIGVIYFIQCLTNVGVVYFEKEIQFKKFFIYQFSGTLADVVVSLVLVYYLQSVWALFYGLLAANLVRLLFSFILSRHRPTLLFSYSKAKELFRFGRWIFGGRIFTFIGLQLDSIIVSAFLGLYSLGIYQMAFRIGNLPISQMANVMGKIVFPTFSKVQDEKEKLKDYFLTALNLLSLVILPVIILVFCFIPEFTTLFLGSKWIEIVPIVRILILTGFVRIIATLLDYFFSAIGTPKVSANLQLIRSIAFGVVVGPLGYFWGITGVAWGGLIAIVVVTILFFPKACTHMNITLRDLHRNLFQLIIYALLVAGGILFTKGLIMNESIVIFAVEIIFTMFVYVGVGLTIGYFTGVKLFQRAIGIVKSFKN